VDGFTGDASFDRELLLSSSNANGGDMLNGNAIWKCAVASFDYRLSFELAFFPIVSNIFAVTLSVSRQVYLNII